MQTRAIPLLALSLLASLPACGSRSLLAEPADAAVIAAPADASTRSATGPDGRVGRPDGRTDACIPPPGLSVWATLETLPDGALRARLLNAGCAPIYRWVGCCNEGAPLIETRDDEGTWIAAACSPTRPRICCDAEPQCVPIAPGQEVTSGVPELEACECGEGTFRATFTYFNDPECAMDDLHLTLSATSHPIGLLCTDPTPAR